MARISSSAKVKSVKGKVGNLIFAGVRGGAVVKRHVQGPDAKSDSQLAVRSAFSMVKNSWLSLSSEVINSWVRFAKDLKGTGYNFFLSANVGQERTDDWRILTPLNYKVEAVESIEIAAGVREGEATVSWVAGGAAAAHKAWVFVREVETSEVVHEATWRADVSVGEVDIDGLVVGKEYRFYLLVCDGSQATGDRFSRSVEKIGEGAPAPVVHFSDGYETNDFTAWTGTGTAGVASSIATTSARAKAGAYSAKAAIESGVGGDYARCYKTAALSVGSGFNIWMSGWFYLAANPENAMRIMQLNSVGGADAEIIKLSSSGELYVLSTISGSHYQGSPIAIPLSQWVGIEARVFVHDSDGVLEVWQDESRILEATGIDTLSSGNWEDIYFGAVYMDGNQTALFELFLDAVSVQNQQKIF